MRALNAAAPAKEPTLSTPVCWPVRPLSPTARSLNSTRLNTFLAQLGRVSSRRPSTLFSYARPDRGAHNSLTKLVSRSHAASLRFPARALRSLHASYAQINTTRCYKTRLSRSHASYAQMEEIAPTAPSCTSSLCVTVALGMRAACALSRLAACALPSAVAFRVVFTVLVAAGS